MEQRRERSEGKPGRAGTILVVEAKYGFVVWCVDQWPVALPSTSVSEATLGRVGATWWLIEWDGTDSEGSGAQSLKCDVRVWFVVRQLLRGIGCRNGCFAFGYRGKCRAIVSCIACRGACAAGVCGEGRVVNRLASGAMSNDTELYRSNEARLVVISNLMAGHQHRELWVRCPPGVPRGLQCTPSSSPCQVRAVFAYRTVLNETARHPAPNTVQCKR